ncbi:DUF6939 family protein [Actinoplanes sp. G11-F43]|uniref:DUF6939 family protein n=1 Tax=Actinoplanes sp. G11-F43 TaxID=3424130 RepID=UPI003D327B5D
MSVHVASRRRKPESVRAAFPGATVVDVTSRAAEPWVRLSPFYPHGGIPVPLTPGAVAASVEGIWQALKVFEQSDIDPGKLSVVSMTGLKRTVRRHGPVLGHRAGLHGTTLLDYPTARRQIYLPAYRWVLEHRVPDLVERLRGMTEGGVVLLDYTTNGDPADTSSPLSHAALLARYLTDRWPGPTDPRAARTGSAVSPDRSMPGPARTAPLSAQADPPAQTDPRPARNGPQLTQTDMQPTQTDPQRAQTDMHRPGTIHSRPGSTPGRPGMAT